MSWGHVVAAGVTSITARHAAYKTRVAELRAQGNHKAADEMEAQYILFNEALAAKVAATRELVATREGPKIIERVYVRLPTPALLYESPWWPWLVLGTWLRLWGWGL